MIVGAEILETRSDYIFCLAVQAKCVCVNSVVEVCRIIAPFNLFPQSLDAHEGLNLGFDF